MRAACVAIRAGLAVGSDVAAALDRAKLRLDGNGWIHVGMSLGELRVAGFMMTAADRTAMPAFSLVVGASSGEATSSPGVSIMFAVRESVRFFVMSERSSRTTAFESRSRVAVRRAYPRISGSPTSTAEKTSSGSQVRGSGTSERFSS